jgi:hypothetical protein
VTKYKEIASAGKKLLRTDIPQEILPSFIQLGLKVKNANVSNVDLNKSKNFPTGKNPNYEAMRELVQDAITKTKPVASTPSSTATKKPTSSTTTTKKPKASATPGATQNLNDACAYDPTQSGN